jgi:hypothetical protein
MFGEMIVTGETFRSNNSIESARTEAKRVLALIANAAVHPAIIYGAGLPEDGIRG